MRTACVRLLRNNLVTAATSTLQLDIQAVYPWLDVMVQGAGDQLRQEGLEQREWGRRLGVVSCRW